jgi:hypothetical protein
MAAAQPPEGTFGTRISVGMAVSATMTRILQPAAVVVRVRCRPKANPVPNPAKRCRLCGRPRHCGVTRPCPNFGFGFRSSSKSKVTARTPSPSRPLRSWPSSSHGVGHGDPGESATPVGWWRRCRGLIRDQDSRSMAVDANSFLVPRAVFGACAGRPVQRNNAAPVGVTTDSTWSDHSPNNLRFKSMACPCV